MKRPGVAVTSAGTLKQPFASLSGTKTITAFSGGCYIQCLFRLAEARSQVETEPSFIKRVPRRWSWRVNYKSPPPALFDLLHLCERQTFFSAVTVSRWLPQTKVDQLSTNTAISSRCFPTCTHPFASFSSPALSSRHLKSTSSSHLLQTSQPVPDVWIH